MAGLRDGLHFIDARDNTIRQDRFLPYLIRTKPRFTSRNLLGHFPLRPHHGLKIPGLSS